MKKDATCKENIKFLISMYERELKQKGISLEEEEIYKNFIIELNVILDLSEA